MKGAAALALAALLGCGEAARPPQPAAIAPGPKTPETATVEPGFELRGSAAQGGLVAGTAAAGVAALLLDGRPVRLGPGGGFIIGFDRDHGPTALLEARLGNGRILHRSLSVAPRAWKVEHVNVAQRPSTATADFLRRREGELARIAEARRSSADSDGWRQAFIWPARGRISGLFGSQRIHRGVPAAYHSGVDVAAGAGARVSSPADGVVVLAGPPAFSLEGNLVIVDHGMGLNSAFLHLATVAVTAGQRIRQGEAIGTVGATGRATGPHLHWSVKWNEARLDPAGLAGPMAMR